MFLAGSACDKPHGGISMIRTDCILPAGILAACLFVPAGLLAGAESDASKSETNPAKAVAPAETGKPADAAKPATKPKPQLSPAQAALRNLVRGALVMHQKQPLNTRENSATEITSYCLAFGCGAEVLQDGVDGNRVNGVTCLCWGYPCAGFELLALSQGHVAARIGYGYQEHPGEFLAMLALRASKRTTRSASAVLPAPWPT